MRLFIGYGYNPRDEWIERLIFPLVRAFGCEIVHGKAVYGGTLPEEILKLIRSSDAMIGFTTRRERLENDRFTTHPWVIQEFIAAHSQAPSIPFVEVREDGVSPPGGILDALNTQRIDYKESKTAECFVDIARALERLRGQVGVTTVRLGPESVVEQIGPLLDDPGFVCRFQTLRGAMESPPRETSVFPIGGGLFLKLKGLTQGELVRLTVSVGGLTWRSNYEPVDTVDVRLRGAE
jgi:hypothetical protein